MLGMGCAPWAATKPAINAKVDVLAGLVVCEIVPWPTFFCPSLSLVVVLEVVSAWDLVGLAAQADYLRLYDTRRMGFPVQV